MRALPIVLDYHKHDIVTGTISHLPHIIAASLVNFVRDTDTKDELMKTLAAGGFKDITRIASSSPTMWEHICAQNQSNISQILGNYIETLNEAKKLVDAGDSQGSTICSTIPGTTAIPCQTVLPARSSVHSRSTVTSRMKPV